MTEALSTLRTLRDVLRYAISRFRAAGLVHGHGAPNALDEAAFLILEALSLPVDQLEPFLEARLLESERARLLALIEARVETRKPAAYLLGCTYLQGERFLVDERVIVPRSYLAELIDGELPGLPGEVGRVLELCTGSGCLAILAAKTFGGHVDAVDLSPQALEVAKANVALHGLEDRIRLFEGDLFTPLPPARYDLIIANPPYVDDAAMAALPPEYRHEPALALAGGADGLDVVRRILDEAGARLSPDGALIVEIGLQRARLEAHYPDLPFLWLDTEASEGEVFLLPAEALVRRV